MSSFTSTGTIVYRPNRSLDLELDLEAGIPHMTASSLSDACLNRHPSSSTQFSSQSAVDTTASTESNPFEDLSLKFTPNQNREALARDSISSSNTIIPMLPALCMLPVDGSEDPDDMAKRPKKAGMSELPDIQTHGFTNSTVNEAEQETANKKQRWAKRMLNNDAIQKSTVILIYMTWFIISGVAFAVLLVLFVKLVEILYEKVF